MPEKSDVIYAVKVLLPFIDEKLPYINGQSLTSHLNLMITRSEAGEITENELLAVFSGYPIYQSWLRKSLFITTSTRSGSNEYPEVYGMASNIEAAVFVCPFENGHFKWVRRKVGMPVPPCPLHNCNLIPTT